MSIQKFHKILIAVLLVVVFVISFAICVDEQEQDYTPATLAPLVTPDGFIELTPTPTVTEFYSPSPTLVGAEPCSPNATPAETPEGHNECTHKYQYRYTIPATVFHDGCDIEGCIFCGKAREVNKTKMLVEGKVNEDKCTMIDYTKQALPLEEINGIKDNGISKLLFAISEGENRYAVRIKSNGVPVSSSKWYFLMYQHLYLQDYYRFSGHSRLGSITDIEVEATGAEKAVQDYQFVLRWGDRIIKELGITKNTLQKDAVRKINYYLVANWRYDYEGKFVTLRESIENNCGKCFCYTQAFSLLCHKCGICAYYEVNYERGHAYNFVVFSDGQRKYVDTTWNDALIGYEGETLTVFEFANRVWASDPQFLIQVKGTNRYLRKEEFLEGYIEKYLLLNHEPFLLAHSGWSLSDSEWIFDYLQLPQHTLIPPEISLTEE